MSIIQFIERSPAPIALPPAVAYLGEPEGIAFDFLNMQMYIRDKTTPANNFLGDPNVRLTYQAPSPKWITNSAGVLVSGTTLRTDYHPVTHVPLGLLVEEQRTNLLLQSSAFDNASWAKLQVSATVDATTAPDGTVTADKLVENTTTNVHEARQIPTITSGAAVCLSFYAKAAERGFAELCLVNTNYVTTRYDLTAGTIPSSSDSLGTVFSNRNASITPYGNGWFRCVLSATTTGITTVQTLFRPALNGIVGGSNYLGDGASGIYAWGAQLEVVAPTVPNVSSYIPTTTATVTRNFDNIWMLGSGFGLRMPMTMVAEGYLDPIINGSNGNYYMALSDGTNSNLMNIVDVGATRSQIITGGVVQFDVTVGATPTLGQLNKAAQAAATNDAVLCRLGVLSAVDTSVTLPVVDRLSIGNRKSLDNGTQLNDHLTRCKIIPRRMSNAELQALTT